MKNKKMKLENEKGITLIALVITIIVLLILAGVTINLTLGDNGIFKIAEQAARNYKEAENQELGLLDDFTNTVDKKINNLQYGTLASKAKPGDYVKYDGGNGYTGLWQVLYNDSTYGLQIISADIVNEDNLFTLGSDDDEAKAKADYNDAINILNNECRKYVNTKYAVSGRCVGSNPLNPDDVVTDTVTLQFEYNGTKESGYKVADTNYETDYNAMKIATSQNNIGIIGKKYWLASRLAVGDRGYAQFTIRCVNDWGNDNAHNVCYISSAEVSYLGKSLTGLRPVITLYSDIKTNIGDGSIDKPFELMAK